MSAIKNSKRVASLCLIAFTLLGTVLTGCSSKNDQNSNKTTAELSSTSVGETTTTDVTTADNKLECVDVKNLNGYNFRFLVINNKYPQFLDVENLSGEILNDTIYERNATVEDRYDTVITITEDAAALATAKKSIAAGDDICDVVTGRATESYSMIKDKYYVDYSKLDSLRLDMPYWDQRVQKQLSIYDQIYLLSGDATVVDDTNTFVIMYNKNMYSDNKFDNPYDLVSNGKWTFDKFWEMSKLTTADLDGDGLLNEKDQFGLLTEYSALYYMYTGSGMSPMSKNNAGEYDFSVSDEKTLNILSKIFAIGTEKKQYCMICDDGSWNGSYESENKIFIDGRGLFRTTALGDITKMRDMDYDFGVLPIPKYDENQSEYYSLVSWGAQLFSTPITVSDPEMTGLILEALSYESYYSLNDVFYEVLLGSKLIRDQESKDMLDIVFDSKCYDLDYTATISGFFNAVAKVAKTGKDTISSTLASQEESMNIKIENFLASFK